MAITAADVINRLKTLFPNGIIYEEQYRKHTGALSFEIYKQAKTKQMSSIQWLTSNGFVWKNTGTRFLWSFWKMQVFLMCL